MISCLISGGQTGADQGGLFAAEELGINTFGYVPKGWRTEAGPAPWLGERFGLMEMDTDDYVERTIKNVQITDGTVIFGRRSRGSNRTEEECRLAGKPFCWIVWPIPDSWENNPGYHVPPRPQAFRLWLTRHNIKNLNVAGNRESKKPGLQEFVKSFLIKALA